MRALRLIAAVAIGIALTTVLLASVVMAGERGAGRVHRVPVVTSSSASGAPLSETPLTEGSEVYEINDDGRGNLWISEYGSDSIRQFHMATRVYTVYQGMGGVDDARRDSGDNVWYSDYDRGALGKLDLSSGQAMTWVLPGSSQPWGVALDPRDNVWVVDEDEPYIFQYEVSATRLCTYTVPDGGESEYIVADGSKFWIGDNVNGRLVKLDAGANTFTSYQVPYVSYPEGLDIGDDGELWWADEEIPVIGQLKPSALEIYTYTLPNTAPAGRGPDMLDYVGGNVWFTHNVSGTFGVLNPAQAMKVSSNVTATTTPASPRCALVRPHDTFTPTTVTGASSFTSLAFTETVQAKGWKIYQLPSDSDPWPIRYTQGKVWIGDQDRDRLIRYSNEVYLPIVIKD